MINYELRKAIKESGFKHWQVADMLNVSEATFVRKLRRELSIAEKEKILNAIKNKGGM